MAQTGLKPDAYLPPDESKKFFEKLRLYRVMKEAAEDIQNGRPQHFNCPCTTVPVEDEVYEIHLNGKPFRTGVTCKYSVVRDVERGDTAYRDDLFVGEPGKFSRMVSRVRNTEEERLRPPEPRGFNSLCTRSHEMLRIQAVN